jgi:hypothetical protein
MMRAPAKKTRAIRKTMGRSLASGLLAPAVPASTRRASSFSTASAALFASLVLTSISIILLPGKAVADPASPAPLGARLGAGEVPQIASRQSLEDLLSVPTYGFAWEDESTDEALAAAVIAGNDPDLERRSPFRKRKFDLFRSEHQLEIGQAEMLLRFRVRAKARNTMSVELKF